MRGHFPRTRPGPLNRQIARSQPRRLRTSNSAIDSVGATRVTNARPGEPLRLGPVDYLRESQDVAVELAQGGILYSHRFALGLVRRIFLLAPFRAGRRVDLGSHRPAGDAAGFLAGRAGRRCRPRPTVPSGRLFQPRNFRGRLKLPPHLGDGLVVSHGLLGALRRARRGLAHIGRWSDPDDKRELLIDGRNRLDALAIARLLSVDDEGRLCTPRWSDDQQCWISTPERIKCQYVSGSDPYAIALSFNLHRRHLTSAQKRDLISKVLKARPEVSNATVAKQTMADDKTVAKVRRKLEAISEIPRSEKRKDDRKGR